MDETTIKTNLGLILQLVLAKAIEKAGYSAIHDYQYDSTCEKPDFLIPDGKKPRYMVEVHQTEARNSFQMKTLRAFTAVTESKAFYGDNLIAVNVLFGDPAKEVPASNLRALCGVFDVNLVPRKEVTDKQSVIKMEKDALELAGDDDYKNKTSQSAKEVISKNPKAVAAIAEMLKAKLGPAKARAELFPIWKAERQRVAKLSIPPKAGMPTYYKRGLLGSLFLADDHFREVLSSKDLAKCSADARRQLVVAGLATVEEQIDGDLYLLDPHFKSFLADPGAATLRALCLSDLADVREINWFFEDIRNVDRRNKMARIFLQEARKGKASLMKAFSKSFRTSDAFGVGHARCWIADLMPLAVGKSHNYFNKAIYAHPDYDVPLGNPYNNIAIRSARLGADERVLLLLERLACEVFFDTLKSEGIDLDLLSEQDLAVQLLNFRIGAAIKLRKLDPLLLVVADIASRYGLSVSVEAIPNALADLAGQGGAGTFRIAVILHAPSNTRVLLNAVAVHDSHGDDKSKEWGARRLATLYRVERGKVTNASFDKGLFVLDGEWEDKDVARLHRSGWTHICHLDDVEGSLKAIFGLKAKVKGAKAKLAVIGLGEGDEDA